MIFGEGFVTLVLLGLWIFCIIDVITTDEAKVRNLPKILWLMIVIILPDVGSIAWLVAGRNWNSTVSAPRGRASTYAEHDRPGRRVATNPDDDEDFLRGLRQRADDQRRSHEQKRQAELKAEEDRLKKPRSDDS